jgi:hypothetical protein
MPVEAQQRNAAASLYGVTLGSAFAPPDCNGAAQPNELCSAQVMRDPDGGLRHVIYFPVGGTPDTLLREFFLVRVFGGTVDAVTAFTKGVSVQSAILADLTAKFGPPPDLARQMRTGVDVVTATWIFANGDQVIFAGALDKLEEGQISAWSARELQRLYDEAEKRRQ